MLCQLRSHPGNPPANPAMPNWRLRYDRYMPAQLVDDPFEAHGMMLRN